MYPPHQAHTLSLAARNAFLSRDNHNLVAREIKLHKMFIESETDTKTQGRIRERNKQIKATTMGGFQCGQGR